MITISKLGYRYQAQQALKVDAFQLNTGEHAVVLGPSGCGKSTFLHLLAGILRPQEGLLRVDGTKLGDLSQRDIDAWRGKTIGFLPQRLALVPSLTVNENLLLSNYANGSAADSARAQSLLQALGLDAKSKAYPHQLSGGQRQRVAIARAVFNRPKLLLADEPTANLDDDASDAVLTLLTGQANAVGASLVIATHDARVTQAMPQATTLRLGVPVLEGAHQ